MACLNLLIFLIHCTLCLYIRLLVPNTHSKKKKKTRKTTWLFYCRWITCFSQGCHECIQQESLLDSSESRTVRYLARSRGNLSQESIPPCECIKDQNVEETDGVLTTGKVSERPGLFLNLGPGKTNCLN